MEQLNDRQALILALFNYGLARDEEEIAEQLRLDAQEAARLCASLAQRGFIQLGAVVTLLAA